jgi:hypothetical protein
LPWRFRDELSALFVCCGCANKKPRSASVRREVRTKKIGL